MENLFWSHCLSGSLGNTGHHQESSFLSASDKKLDSCKSHENWIDISIQSFKVKLLITAMCVIHQRVVKTASVTPEVQSWYGTILRVHTCG